MLQLAERIRQLSGSASRIVFEPLPQDDPVRRRSDITLARTALGWEPRVSLDEGLQLTLAHFGGHPMKAARAAAAPWAAAAAAAAQAGSSAASPS